MSGDVVWLVERTGLSYRQVDYWLRCGYLRTETGGGSGYPRTIPDDEIQVAVILAELVTLGMRSSAAVPLARWLARDGLAVSGHLQIVWAPGLPPFRGHLDAAVEDHPLPPLATVDT